MKNLYSSLILYFKLVISKLLGFLNKLKESQHYKPIAIFSVLAGISTFLSNNIPLFDKLYDKISHDDRLIERTITKYSEKSIDLNELFAVKNVFFHEKDNRILSNNELIESADFHNDDMHIHIVPTNPKCTDKYIMLNENLNGRTIHKILPIDNNTLELVLPGHSNGHFLDGIFDDPVFDDYSESNENNMNIMEECVIEGTEYLLHENPGLQIVINNNSPRNISIDRVEIDVKKSVRNVFPVIRFSRAEPFSLPFINEGWGDASNIEMKFNIQNTFNQVLNYQIVDQKLETQL